MIDFKYADLFKQNSVDVQLEIISDDEKSISQIRNFMRKSLN